MRKCVVCQREIQETREHEEYCSIVCEIAARLNMTREQCLGQSQEHEKQFDAEARRAGEAGYGNCVIFRDDGGYNRQYLTIHGTWTVDRAEAARCLDNKEARDLAEKHRVDIFGRSEADPTCDILSFRFPDDYNKWLADNWSEMDADNPDPTQRFIDANLASALPHLLAKKLLRGRGARRDNPEGGSQAGGTDGLR
jgi:hypothetical protein